MGISRQDATALIRRIADAANARDIPALRDLYAEDAIVISPAMNQLRGRDQIAAAWELMLTTFPDWKVCPDEVLIDGDRIIALGMNTATDRKGWFGLPPTGGTINYRAVLLLTIAEGKIVREERIYDISAVLQLLEKARLDGELKTAAEMQGALLSRTARMGGHYESVGDSVACRTIGGDFFEFVELPSGALGIVIGDVAGKGPAAALLASMLQGMFAVEAGAGNRPAVALSAENRALVSRGLGSRFATLVYAVLSPDGTFAYSNAGHNPPIVMTQGKIRRLTMGGPILGGFANARFEEESVYLNDGDLVLMFTDGVTEACNPEGDDFGEERLLTWLTENETLPVAEIVQGILSEVRQFCQAAPQTDDITVTATRYLRRT